MPDQHGICDRVHEVIAFLNKLKEYYWECPYCNNMYSPLAPKTWIMEEPVCDKCLEEGV